MIKKINGQDILLVCFIVAMSTLLYFSNAEFSNHSQQVFGLEFSSDKAQDITKIDYSQITMEKILKINNFEGWNKSDKDVLLQLSMQTSTDLSGSTNYSNDHYLTILDDASPRVRQTFYMILSMWIDNKTTNNSLKQDLNLKGLHL